MADIRCPRRYYLHQRIDALACGEPALSGAWRAKQEAQPGTALPSDFPLRLRLIDAGYSTIEDIDGADATELAKVGFSAAQSASILAAVTP